MYSQKNQIIERIKQANNILLLGKEYYSGDDIATLLAWHIFLESAGKKNDIVINNFESQNKFKFLPNEQNIQNGLKKLKKFTIAVDISQTNLDDFNYDINTYKLTSIKGNHGRFPLKRVILPVEAGG